MVEVKADALRAAVSRFSSARVLVIGDIIVDQFIWGSVSRISPEAPVPVVNVTQENLLLGGAANVLRNLYSLGAQATLCGVVGDDTMGEKLLDLLRQLHSPVNGVFKVADRPTMVKTRVVAQGQQVVRYDRERTEAFSSELTEQIGAFIESCLPDHDIVVVSDYAKGMVGPLLMESLKQHVKEKNIPFIVDPKPENSSCYVGATLITPNNHEAEIMSGIKIVDDESLCKAGGKILKDLSGVAILVTRGEAGMALLGNDGSYVLIPTVAREVYDVTGAGDTVCAALALGIAVGLSYYEAAVLANFAAGIVVGKVGTAAATAEELLGVIR